MSQLHTCKHSGSACHLHICSRSLRCTHPQRHVLVYHVCAHLRPLNVCVCTSSGKLCVHRPRGSRTDTRFSSPTDLHPSPTTWERSSSRPISAHSHLRALELGHTHVLRALKACVCVLSPTVVYTHVHTQSQVNTDPRGRSQLLIHSLIHSEIHTQLHTEGHLHIRGPSGQSHIFRRSTMPGFLFTM